MTSGKLSFKAIGVSIANSQIIAKVNVGKAVHLTNWRFSFHAIVTSDIDIKDDGQIKLGDGDDIKIYHENSSGLNWIEGTGDLKIQRTDGDIYLNRLIVS